MRKWKVVSEQTVSSIEEFQYAATQWMKTLTPKSVVLLDGLMGVGKTQWVRQSVESLGGKWVSSPSFAVIQRYDTPKGKIDHVDLFRIKNEEDLESTGFWDLFENLDLALMIEWPERIDDSFWPMNLRLTKITISFVPHQVDQRTLMVFESD